MTLFGSHPESVQLLFEYLKQLEVGATYEAWH